MDEIEEIWNKYAEINCDDDIPIASLPDILSITVRERF
jgi:hypothetical protein